MIPTIGSVCMREPSARNCVRNTHHRECFSSVFGIFVWASNRH